MKDILFHKRVEFLTNFIYTPLLRKPNKNFVIHWLLVKCKRVFS
jgi:hypothetical protein